MEALKFIKRYHKEYLIHIENNKQYEYFYYLYCKNSFEFNKYIYNHFKRTQKVLDIDKYINKYIKKYRNKIKDIIIVIPKEFTQINKIIYKKNIGIINKIIIDFISYIENINVACDLQLLNDNQNIYNLKCKNLICNQCNINKFITNERIIIHNNWNINKLHIKAVATIINLSNINENIFINKLIIDTLYCECIKNINFKCNIIKININYYNFYKISNIFKISNINNFNKLIIKFISYNYYTNNKIKYYNDKIKNIYDNLLKTYNNYYLDMSTCINDKDDKDEKIYTIKIIK